MHAQWDLQCLIIGDKDRMINLQCLIIDDKDRMIRNVFRAVLQVGEYITHNKRHETEDPAVGIFNACIQKAGVICIFRQKLG